MEIFKVENITYYYPDNEFPSLKQVSFKINDGELVLVVGPSGSGKSTLLKLLAGLVPNFYGGTLSGKVFFKGRDVTRAKKVLVPEIGIVFQEPEKQIILTDVEREIVFGMENLGMSKDLIKRRLAETLDFMGIRELMQRKTLELSGGQKQLVAIAGVLVMNPEVLLMDEPTSQLDLIHAEEVLNIIRKIAEETGKTVIMTEHKLERCLHFVDRVIAMKEGEVVFQGKPQEYCRWSIDNGFGIVPPIPRFFGELSMGVDPLPITVKEGRKVLLNMKFAGEEAVFDRKAKVQMKTEVLPEIEIKNLWFSYDNVNDVLKNISLRIYKGEFVSILGQSGAGKTTLIKNINGLLKPVKGKVEIQGRSIEGLTVYELSKKIGFLNQTLDNYLFNETVEEEIKYTLNNFKIEWTEKIYNILNKLGINQLKHKNPRDLSVGQKLRVVLAIILSAYPNILILDEPTRGMDYLNKAELGKLLLELKNQGVTIILATHDVEFAGEFCDRVVILFNGEIVADGNKKDVLVNNLYYSTQISKLFYGIRDVVVFEEAKKYLKEFKKE